MSLMMLTNYRLKIIRPPAWILSAILNTSLLNKPLLFFRHQVLKRSGGPDLTPMRAILSRFVIFIIQPVVSAGVASGEQWTLEEKIGYMLSAIWTFGKSCITLYEGYDDFGRYRWRRRRKCLAFTFNIEDADWNFTRAFLQKIGKCVRNNWSIVDVVCIPVV